MQQSRNNAALLYAINISNYFQARSGSHEALTLDEWSCIQKWREDGISLDRVFRAIDLALSAQPDRVPSLLHCRAAVLEATKRSS